MPLSANLNIIKRKAEPQVGEIPLGLAALGFLIESLEAAVETEAANVLLALEEEGLANESLQLATSSAESAELSNSLEAASLRETADNAAVKASKATASRTLAEKNLRKIKQSLENAKLKAQICRTQKCHNSNQPPPKDVNPGTTNADPVSGSEDLVDEATGSAFPESNLNTPESAKFPHSEDLNGENAGNLEFLNNLRRIDEEIERLNPIPPFAPNLQRNYGGRNMDVFDNNGQLPDFNRY
ncbi:hypothetical protein BB561_000509 [Smittium simulii]|uniref:Uncharacterized protein n=1 Tax=Smittium simulii TaxID=133385 RepID=A0A2T9YYS2_9FUNG|nr:hypothetical protein BB561_000509 [Smittium simulii]